MLKTDNTNNPGAVTNRTQRPRHAKGHPVSYYLCCLKREDRPNDLEGGDGEGPVFHFHEVNMNDAYGKRIGHQCETCTPGDPKCYEPVDLTSAEGSAEKQEFEKYKQMRLQLLEHRMKIEIQLKKSIRGSWPPPHIVMDKLLQMSGCDAKDFPASDEVLQGRLSKLQTNDKTKKKKSVQEKSKLAEPILHTAQT